MKKPQSLEDWQGMFGSIYGERNAQLYKPSDVLLHVVEAMTELAEDLRKEKREGILVNIPDLFAWMLSFCNIMDINLEQAVWHKYPNICPYCLEEQKCICITQDSSYNPGHYELEKFRMRIAAIPLALIAWQNMFNRIYGQVNKVKYGIQIWFHLFEEIGEVSKAFRFQDYPEMQAELADSFAWLMAVCTKMGEDLDNLVWQVYSGKCRVCAEAKCICPIV